MSKKIMALFAIAMLCLGTATLTGCIELDDDEEGVPDKVVVGTSADFPPFEYIDEETGEITGFDIELVKEIADDQGINEVEVQDQDFGTLIDSLEAGEIDLIAAAMTVTEERDQRVDFTDPYYEADQSILVREGEAENIDSFEDLEGMNVGAQLGTTGENVVQEQLIDEGIIDEEDYSSYDRYDFAVSDLEDERIDAIVLDKPVADSFEADRAVEIAFIHETDEEYAFAVQEGDDELREALNDGIENLKEESTYDDLVQEYFG